MHPDLLRVLANARHEDLLNERRHIRRGRVRLRNHSRWFARSRRLVGSLLIWAGARVIGDQPARLDQRARLDLSHE
jgi:hypothetical protein